LGRTAASRSKKTSPGCKHEQILLPNALARPSLHRPRIPVILGRRYAYVRVCGACPHGSRPVKTASICPRSTSFFSLPPSEHAAFGCTTHANLRREQGLAASHCAFRRWTRRRHWRFCATTLPPRSPSPRPLLQGRPSRPPSSPPQRAPVQAAATAASGPARILQQHISPRTGRSDRPRGAVLLGSPWPTTGPGASSSRLLLLLLPLSRQQPLPAAAASAAAPPPPPPPYSRQQFP
jgi:hypothetical protein